jgi:hypothetical protein
VTFPAAINGSSTPKGWRYRLDPIRDTHLSELEGLNREQGVFRQASKSIYFPLWYPPLIFAVAGVGVLRFRRQFSIRSAFVAVSVVAALLGMAVIL